MDKPKPTPTSAHTLEKIVKGADIFLGLSTGWHIEARYDRAHGEGPTDLGAGHPDAGNQFQKTPRYRPDSIIATGRSDIPIK